MIFPLILFKCLFELEDDQIKDLAKNVNAVFEKGHWMHKKVVYFNSFKTFSLSKIMLFALDILECWRHKKYTNKVSSKYKNIEMIRMKYAKSGSILLFRFKVA